MSEFFDYNQKVIIYALLFASMLALVYSRYLFKYVFKTKVLDRDIEEINNYVYLGAKAYLKQQAKKIKWAVLFLSIFIFLSVYLVPPTKETIDYYSSWSYEDLLMKIGRAHV